jgi:hypothetical protein
VEARIGEVLHVCEAELQVGRAGELRIALNRAKDRAVQRGACPDILSADFHATRPRFLTC